MSNGDMSNSDQEPTGIATDRKDDTSSDCIPAAGSTNKSWRFWTIITSLSITGVLGAIDGTILTTALPSIAAALGGGEKYVWVISAYFLAR
jgi:hypothetical protein